MKQSKDGGPGYWFNVFECKEGEQRLFVLFQVHRRRRQKCHQHHQAHSERSRQRPRTQSDNVCLASAQLIRLFSLKVQVMVEKSRVDILCLLLLKTYKRLENLKAKLKLIVFFLGNPTSNAAASAGHQPASLQPQHRAACDLSKGLSWVNLTQHVVLKYFFLKGDLPKEIYWHSPPIQLYKVDRRSEKQSYAANQ